MTTSKSATGRTLVRHNHLLDQKYRLWWFDHWILHLKGGQAMLQPISSTAQTFNIIKLFRIRLKYRVCTDKLKVQGLDESLRFCKFMLVPKHTQTQFPVTKTSQPCQISFAITLNIL